MQGAPAAGEAVVGLGGVAPGVGALRLVPGPAAAVLRGRVEVGVELEDTRHRPVEEVSVVGDDDRAALAGDHPLLEPAQPGEVEVVRRLVQEGDAEVGKLDAGQCHLGPLAPGQGRRVSSGQLGTDAQVVEDLLDPGVEVARPEGGEPLERRLVAPLGLRGALHQAGGGRGQLRLGVDAAGPAGQRPAHRLPRDRLVLLGEVADGSRRRVEGDRPIVGLQDPGKQLEQRGLAGAVGTDHTEPGPGADRQRDVGQHGAPPTVVAERASHQGGLAEWW